jgi:hypothetical protein
MFAYERPQNCLTYMIIPSPEFIQQAYSFSVQSSGTAHTGPVQFKIQVTGYSDQSSLYMQSAKLKLFKINLVSGY